MEEKIENLDPRGHWDKLPKYPEPRQNKEVVDVSKEDLELLCRQKPCSVEMFRFNVCTRISDAYQKQCSEKQETPYNIKLNKLYKAKGFSIYKKFYQPRLEWFDQQQEYYRNIRQDELYIKANLHAIKNGKAEKAEVDKQPENVENSENAFLKDSLPLLSSQEFMQNIANLPYTSTSTQQLAGESVSAGSSLSVLINDL